MSLKPHNPCNLLCQHDILHDECLPRMSALATEYFEAWEKECKLTAKLTADIQRIADKAKGVPQAEPPPNSRRQMCTCTGTCRGAKRLGNDWMCAMETCGICGWHKSDGHAPGCSQVCGFPAGAAQPGDDKPEGAE